MKFKTESICNINQLHLVILMIPALVGFSQSLSSQLYVFDFNLKGTEAERTKLVSDIGYKGLTFNVTGNEQREKLSRYLLTDEFKTNKLKIPVVYAEVRFNNAEDNSSSPRWKKTLNVLPSGTDLWLLIHETDATPEKLRNLLRTACKDAALLGKNVVIYPHDKLLLEGVEDALPYLNELKLSNLFVSFHLCHELRENNKNRLREVFQKALPYLKYVSISGSLNNVNLDAPSAFWEDAIRPLDDSEIDILGFVKIMEEVNYKGPVFLHTFGITRDAKDHLTSSMNVWQAIANPPKIPGTFQAERFVSKLGSSKLEFSPGGGQNLGLIKNNDFTEYYLNVSKTSQYDFDFYASSLNSTGGSIKVFSNNVLLGTIKIPSSGFLHDYKKYNLKLNLNAGLQKLRFVYSGGNNQYLLNLDRVEVSQALVSSVESAKKAILEVYPNPSEDGIFNLTETAEYKVYNAQGLPILSGKAMVIDLSQQTQGLYMLRIGSEQLKLLR